MPLFKLEDCLRDLREGKLDTLDFSLFRKPIIWEKRSFDVPSGYSQGYSCTEYFLPFLERLPTGEQVIASKDEILIRKNRSQKVFSTYKVSLNFLAVLPTGEILTKGIDSDSPFSPRNSDGMLDERIKIWNSSTGQCLINFLVCSHSEWGDSSHLTLLPAGEAMIVKHLGSGQQSINVWNLSTGRCLRTLNITFEGKEVKLELGDKNTPIKPIAMLPTGHCVSFAYSGNQPVQLRECFLAVWSPLTGQCLRVSSDFWKSKSVRDCHFTVLKTGEVLLCSNGDRMTVWDPVEGKVIHSFYTTRTDFLMTLPTGEVVFQADDVGRCQDRFAYEKTLNVWDPLTREYLINEKIGTIRRVLSTGEIAWSWHPSSVYAWGFQKLTLTAQNILPLMDSLENLKQLSFKNIQLNNQILSKLTTLIDSSQHLEFLNLEDTNLTEEQALMLRSHLMRRKFYATCGKFPVFEFSGLSAKLLTAEDILPLMDSFHHFNQLSFKNIQLNNQIVSTLTVLIDSSQHLKFLNLENTGLTREQALMLNSHLMQRKFHATCGKIPALECIGLPPDLPANLSLDFYSDIIIQLVKRLDGYEQFKLEHEQLKREHEQIKTEYERLQAEKTRQQEANAIKSTITQLSLETCTLSAEEIDSMYQSPESIEDLLIKNPLIKIMTFPDNLDIWNDEEKARLCNMAKRWASLTGCHFMNLPKLSQKSISLSKVPDHYYCVISKHIFWDPIMIEGGDNYEREEYQKFINSFSEDFLDDDIKESSKLATPEKRKPFDPMTLLDLEETNCVSNTKLKREIQQFLKAQPPEFLDTEVYLSSQLILVAHEAIEKQNTLKLIEYLEKDPRLLRVLLGGNKYALTHAIELKNKEMVLKIIKKMTLYDWSIVLRDCSVFRYLKLILENFEGIDLAIHFLTQLHEVNFIQKESIFYSVILKEWILQERSLHLLFIWLEIQTKTINDPIDKQGNTWLHYAIARGLSEFSETLLKQGASESIKKGNSVQLTPYDIARQNENFRLKNMLKTLFFVNAEKKEFLNVKNEDVVALKNCKGLSS